LPQSGKFVLGVPLSSSDDKFKRALLRAGRN
jgi:hypothetical protein